MYVLWVHPRNYVNLAHLHIQDGRQNGWFSFPKAHFCTYSQKFWLYKSLLFTYISTEFVQENMQIQLICIFQMAAKMADISSEKHIFLPTVINFPRTSLSKCWYTVNTGSVTSWWRYMFI